MLCVKNGVLVTPAGRVGADIYIENGKIAALGGRRPADQAYDAGGCFIFPGFIDAHTHLQMPVGGIWTADDFESGTRAAVAGGTTSILDFATQDRGRSLREALETWHGRADGRCFCDYGFHMAVTDWNGRTRRELSDMAKAGVTSFKAYMAYDGLRLPEDDLRELLAAAREIGLVGVHCELGDAVNENAGRLLSEGHAGPKWHPKSRPNPVEALAVRRLMELAGEAGAPCWVVHLSTREGLWEIEKAREKGQRVLVETCPQYLTLTEEVYEKPGFEGAKFVCSPPVRSAADRDALWTAVEDGEVDIISTDHCSFRFAGQKELGRGDFSKIPNGLPGIEHRPALLWSSGRVSPERMAALLAENPAKAFGMYPRKGALEIGGDGDLVVWDPSYRGTIAAADMNMNTDYSPWEGTPVTGRAKAVFLRGALAAENGRPTGAVSGQFVARSSGLGV